MARLGTDFAGLGGDAHYVRTKVDGAYYIPLDRLTGNDWDIAISAGTGYLFTLGGRSSIIDRFFLGGDNLRGFHDGGAGPHAVPRSAPATADSLGGRFIWTQSTELRFPLPVSPDLGLSGRDLRRCRRADRRAEGVCRRRAGAFGGHAGPRSRPASGFPGKRRSD